jgi:hypothetical protein
MNAQPDRPVPSGWRWFFLVAAVYDIALGIAFMVAGESILAAIGMETPPHVAYIQLAAVFVTVQGISYLLPWHDAWSNRGVVWVGVAYKASYAALAAWYLALGILPSVFFVPWAVVDLGFMIGFLWFLLRVPARSPVS